MPTVEERLTALEGRVEPDYLRWVADGQTAYRLVLALPGQTVVTLLQIIRDGNGTWALVWGDILPRKDDGSFDTNYERGMPDAMFLGRESGAPYMTTAWLGSLLMAGAGDGSELSGFLSGNTDRAGPFTPTAGTLFKLNGLSWDPAVGMVLSSMMTFHTEEVASQAHHPGHVRLYTGAPNDPGPPILGWEMLPAGKVVQRVPLVSVYNSYAQITSPNAETLLSWDREEVDTDAMHDLATPTRLYARRPGTYRPWASIGWASPPSGAHSVLFRKNGGSIVGRGPGAGGVAYAASSIWLVAGEWIEVWTYQSGGAPAVLDSSRAGLEFVSL